MSSADAQLTYRQGNALEPVQSQEEFARQIDLSQPEKSMSSYQKLMHQHTKQQYQSAISSSRRRSADAEARMSSLSTESSVSSTSS